MRRVTKYRRPHTLVHIGTAMIQYHEWCLSEVARMRAKGVKASVVEGKGRNYGKIAIVREV